MVVGAIINPVAYRWRRGKPLCSQHACGSRAVNYGSLPYIHITRKCNKLATSRDRSVDMWCRPQVALNVGARGCVANFLHLLARYTTFEKFLEIINAP